MRVVPRAFQENDGNVCVLAGSACPWLVAHLRSSLEEAFPQVMKGMPEVIQTAHPVVLPWSIALAFGISMVIGIIFGLYPAIRAAYVDPIEALRHE